MTRRLRPTDAVGVVGNIDPDALGIAAHSTAWIPAKDFDAFMAIVQAGTLGVAATLDAKLEQAQDAAGLGAKDIVGKAITQFTQAGGDNDKQALINLRTEELDVSNDFNHVRLTITVGVAISDGGGVLLGLDPRYGPASNKDALSVAEIVA